MQDERVSSSQAPGAAILEQTRSSAKHEGEWAGLYRDFPFQSWIWFYRWWNFYGEGCYPGLGGIYENTLA